MLFGDAGDVDAFGGCAVCLAVAGGGRGVPLGLSVGNGTGACRGVDGDLKGFTEDIDGPGDGDGCWRWGCGRVVSWYSFREEDAYL